MKKFFGFGSSTGFKIIRVETGGNPGHRRSLEGAGR
jgi:hypothetical protein